jgi:ABC-2 type transport system permease protein
MNNLTNVLWIELRKITRSRIPVFTALAFLVMPLAGAFMMIILKDPEFARKAGLISTKAQLMAGTADWPTYLGIITQAIAIGGILLFSFLGSWVFGREFTDQTVKDLLAVPVSRATLLLAKFIAVALWSAALVVLIYLVGLILGALIGLPQGSPEVLWQGSVRFLITACLVIIVLLPIPFFASIGRGYLLPMGAAVLLILFANIIAVTGWGNYFPWSVPALYSGAAGATYGPLEPISYVLVLLTGVAGIAGTYLWWRRADQSR